MASSKILTSKQFDKLSVNRLDAQTIRSDNILPIEPSYLFSILLKQATFTPTTSGGTLTFNIPLHSGENVIQFTDRPLRQTEYILFNEFVSVFTSDESNNSFAKDPPNAVLVHSKEQRTYKVTYSKSDSNTATFNLDLLPGETNGSNDVITGQMSLFVDGFYFDRRGW